ncbi:unnamed protein product, partial [Effrenium voratum]
SAFPRMSRLCVPESNQDKVQSAATVKKDTAFYEQISNLVPWQLHMVQIARNPKVRRLPPNLLASEPVQHRAAALLYNTGEIGLESEEVTGVMDTPGARFETPVAYAIFIYGAAPSTSYNPEEDKKPEATLAKQLPSPEEKLQPHQPGYKDITFPEVSDAAVPQWIRSVLKRLHVNLGHPGNVYQARRFNDRLMLDIVYTKDIAGNTYCFLSQVDDGTTYHVMSYLENRSEQEVTHCLVSGWFRFFGYPDEMLLDAEGAMKGWNFEQMAAQEMEQIANLATFAKNTLARKSGASPCQWVFGRAPRVLGALLSEPEAIEAKQVIEAMRHSAMQEFLKFEFNESLRNSADGEGSVEGYRQGLCRFPVNKYAASKARRISAGSMPTPSINVEMDQQLYKIVWHLTLLDSRYYHRFHNSQNFQLLRNQGHQHCKRLRTFQHCQRNRPTLAVENASDFRTPAGQYHPEKYKYAGDHPSRPTAARAPSAPRMKLASLSEKTDQAIQIDLVHQLNPHNQLQQTPNFQNYHLYQILIWTTPSTCRTGLMKQQNNMLSNKPARSTTSATSNGLVQLCSQITESMMLPDNNDLDDLHDQEAYVLEVGQVHQDYPINYQYHKQVFSVATKDAEGNWQWEKIFDGINVSPDTADMLFGNNNDNYTDDIEDNKVDSKKVIIEHQLKRQPQHVRHHLLRQPGDRRVRHWLHRHGRHCVHLTGSDGNPPELPTYFQHNNFAQAYHTMVNNLAITDGTHEDNIVMDDVFYHKQCGKPSWCEVKPSTSPTVASVFNVSSIENQEVITGPESSDDEDGGEGETSSRAAKQALKREIPWRAIPEKDIKGFVQAVVGMEEVVKLQASVGQVVSILGVHVDDIICACLPGWDELLERVRKSFKWGSECEKDDFIFVGRRIARQADNGYTIDQVHYVADIILTKIKMDPSEKLSDHPELITEFRSGIGSLQWMAGTTRGDLAADTSLLQKSPQELTVQDLLSVNKVLKYVKATANTFIKVNPIPVEELVFVAYGDSGWANAPGNKSQGGLAILATDKRALHETRAASLLEWKSYRHQRVLRSTLAAEAASLDRAHDVGMYMACSFSEMTDANYKAAEKGIPIYEVIPVTDARSHAIHRLSTSFREKRVEIDVASLRESCRNLRWVPTEKQHADALTKSCPKLRDAFRQWMMAPTVTLVDSKSPEDPEPGNEKWRHD